MTQAENMLAPGVSERHSVLSPQSSSLRRLGALMRRNPLGAFGALLIAALVLAGLFAHLIAPYPVRQFAGAPGLGPSADYPFGTDKFGQDILSRVINGARISLQVGFLAVLSGTLLGLAVGVLSGYKGGVADTVIQRVVDTMIAFPQLILLLI